MIVYRELECKYCKTDTIQRYEGKLVYGMDELLTERQKSKCLYTCLDCNATLTFHYGELEKYVEENYGGAKRQKQIGTNSRDIKPTGRLDAGSIEGKFS